MSQENVHDSTARTQQEYVSFSGTLLETGEDNNAHDKRLTPEAIAGIEQLDDVAPTKVEYLLTASGQKPASLIFLQTPGHMDTSEDAPPPVMPDEILQEHLRAAEAAGLSVIVGSPGVVGRQGGLHAATLELFVGSSPENAARLQDAIQRNDDRTLGLALGYPETAVDAFAKDGPTNTISVRDLPNVPPEIASFTNFRLSRGNYQRAGDCPALGSYGPRSQSCYLQSVHGSQTMAGWPGSEPLRDRTHQKTY